MFIGIYAQTIKCYLINGQSHLPKSRFGQSIRKTRANKTDFSQWSSHLPVYDLYIWKEYHGHIEITILNHLVFWHIFWVFFCWPFSYYWTEICHHTLKRFVPTLSCIGWLIYLLVSANNCVRIFKIYFDQWKQTSLYTGFYLKIVLVNNVFNFNLYPQKQ